MLARLLKALEDPDPGVREACRLVFTRFDHPPFSPEVIPELIVAMRSPVRLVRGCATWSLYPIAHDPRIRTAIPELLRLLKEPVASGSKPHNSPTPPFDLYPSEQAALVLGELAPGTPEAPQVIAALKEVAETGDQSLRQAAARALAEFDPTDKAAGRMRIQTVRDNTEPANRARGTGNSKAPSGN